jgi:hypothetical protein
VDYYQPTNMKQAIADGKERHAEEAAAKEAAANKVREEEEVRAFMLPLAGHYTERARSASDEEQAHLNHYPNEGGGHDENLRQY